MKEELKTLKSSIQQIIKYNDSLKKQRNFFNMKVEEKFNETNLEEFFKENCDSYNAAKELNECFPNIHTIISEIKNEHPKYGNKRIKQLTITKFLEKNEMMIIFESDLNIIIENYFIYESCGFFKVLELEKELEVLGSEIKNTTDIIIDKSKARAVKTGKAVVNIVKPYGEVAKSQFNDASEATKSVVNKGSQKLKTFFEGLEEKTRNNKK